MIAGQPTCAREHLAIRELLPFYLNATLSEHETARVARHIAACAACSRDLEQQRRLAQWLGRIPAEPADVEGAWLRIERRLQSESSKASASRRRVWSVQRWSAAAAVVLVLILPLAGYFASERGGVYRTVTSPDSTVVAGQGGIRAVFAPRATLRDIEELLAGMQYQIVNGPSARGVYTLAPVAPGADTMHVTLAALRASPLVALAEPVASDANER